ncbi:hypothetical protein [Marinactinospora rubrisoli]|uniref:DUF4352 domain-containing protein n=1 Tax=Marinactinospora rubrisoli TaxID=2715399 RepID=A0ABW2KB25_9ACTN
MAHHAPDHEVSPGDLLPRSPVARAVLAAVFAVVASGLLFVLWRTGGFERAPEAPPQPAADTPVRNDMFTLTVEEASIVTKEEFAGTSEWIQVRAELTSHDRSPVRAFAVADMVRPSVLPGGVDVDDDGLEITLERDQEYPVTYLQPEMPETVLLRWPLPERVGAASDVERLRLVVLGAEFAPGFLDQSSSWRATEQEVADLVLPVHGS